MTAQPELHLYNISHGVTAFSTTRHGGASHGNYGEFNINEYCGDNPECVAANRKALADALGIDPRRIIMPHQTHGAEVRQIAEDFLALPDSVRRMILDGVDAVMTNVKGVCVGVSTADCIPVILYDEEHGAVCAVHAGWRGTLAQIALKAVMEMRLAYHTDAAKLRAVIGPGISLDAFEVGNEVYEEFQNAGFLMESISRQMPAMHPGDASEPPLKWHIDLKECNRQQLSQAGLKAECIHVADICTYSDSDNYFSARRLGAESGRIYTAALLNPQK